MVEKKRVERGRDREIQLLRVKEIKILYTERDVRQKLFG